MMSEESDGDEVTNDQAERSNPLPNGGWFRGPLTDLSRIGIPFFVFLVLGWVCTAVYAAIGPDVLSGVRNVAGWLVTAGGMAISGITTGFLFAIPRTLQGRDPIVHSADDRVGSPVTLTRTDSAPRYYVNSNLEQISDWLTKIIVGVGLTQLHNLPSTFWNLSTFLAGGAASTDRDRAFALSVVLYFGVVGFVAGYLLTRVYVTGAFARADLQHYRDATGTTNACAAPPRQE
jgi:hypothetical protein